ncbi:hypothetical protein L7H23_05205 [Sphingopyxis sp. BSN-002]|uniref:hypothetical protein n=1 Tax=Sphingopyxis sp. BSN-002 TaxID=2911495 RepID=UPI001EDA5485|nr:hypothetical protein [Sphingopyxis sp. BSN-002]UKK85508.1 hypothetical protein L7H23_05205 [Sphingopyxis sp. BSN-002]
MILSALLLGAMSPVQPPVVVAPPSPVPVLSFDIAGEGYSMPVPTGYCRTRNLPALYTRDETNEAGVVLAKLAFVFLCDTVGKGPNDQDFIYLKYLKNYDPPQRTREELLAVLTKKMGSQEYVERQESPEYVAQIERKTEAQTGAQIEAEFAVTPLGRDELCVYTGQVMTVAAKRDAAKIRAVSCVTLFNGKIVTIDIASSMDRGLSFVALRDKLYRVVASIEKVES